MRNKFAQRKRTEPFRTPLDMPTTDPGSDLHFSTDDEQQNSANSPRYGTVPRMRKSLLQSDLQRRYIEEIGDSIIKQMPPELIVTSPSKSGKVDIIKHMTPHTAPETNQSYNEQNLMSCGSGVVGRRTYSWHNIYQSNNTNNTNSNNNRTVQKRSPSPFVMSQNIHNLPTADELQLKLSLKKKIWTGMHQSDAGGAQNIDRSRPLSWYMPTVATNQQPLQKEKPQMQAGGNGPVRKGKKIENMNLLNACSKKLILWQQEEANKVNATLTSTVIRASKDSHGNGGEEQTSRIFKQMTIAKKSGTKLINKALEHVGDGRIKRRTMNPLTKITETTQFISRITNKTSTINTALATQRQTKTTVPMISTVSARMHSANSHAIASANGNGNTKIKLSSSISQHNKFKTSGIVVTAVQPIPLDKKNKKQIRIAGGKVKSIPTNVPINITNTKLKEKVDNRNSLSSVGLQATLDSANFVRKVKTKLKKRKSRSSFGKNAGDAGCVGDGGIINCAANTLRTSAARKCTN